VPSSQHITPDGKLKPLVFEVYLVPLFTAPDGKTFYTQMATIKGSTAWIMICNHELLYRVNVRFNNET
jgi:hypothetical protein